ncbi:MAG: hypothetical protein RL636_607 [Verrucomicrobiota bacterium]|jgi:hypothetical protein
MKLPTYFDFGKGKKLTVSRFSIDFEDIKSSRDGAIELTLAVIFLILSSAFLYIGAKVVIATFIDKLPAGILIFGILLGIFGALGIYQSPMIARLRFKSLINLNGDDLEIKIGQCWPLNIRTERSFNYPSNECVLSFIYSYINKRDEHNFHIELTHVPSKTTHIITSTIQPSHIDPSCKASLRNLVNKIREAIGESDITTCCKSSDD